MKLSLSGIELFFEKKPIDTLIELADLFDIEYLDIWVPRNTSVSSKDEILAKLSEYRKKVSCVTTWSHLCREENRENEQSLLGSSLQWAKVLNAPRVNTYFGYLDDRNDERAIEIYANTLEPLLKEAEKEGITICVENEFDSRGHDPNGSDITRSADRLLKLVEAIDSPRFKLTFDASNFYLAQEEYYPYAFERLKNHIDYIHFKDARKFQDDKDQLKKKWSDHGRDYIFCSLLEGVVNWERLIPACEQHNPEWICALEPHTIYTEDTRDIPAGADEPKAKAIKLMGNRVLEDYLESIKYVRKLGIE